MDWADWLGGVELPGVVRGVAALVVGIALARLGRRGVVAALSARSSAQTSMIVGRIVQYSVVVVALFVAIEQFGFDVGILLGAAGILTVALGFAAQTATSNLISGIFLLGEQPFVVSDVIRVGSTTGEVVAIDLMSVRLRTFDNLMVRIPNETLLKSEITNLSHNPIRRIDYAIRVAYEADLDTVRRVLNDVADANPHCLDEPEPQLLFLEFGAQSVDIQYSVWTARERYMELKATLSQEFKAALQAHGIEIPAPQRVAWQGAPDRP